jgi:hypothetical protein
MAELEHQIASMLQGQLNSGPNPKLLPLMIEYAVGTIDRGIYSFNEFVKHIGSKFGQDVLPYLKSAYNGARDWPTITDSGLNNKMTPYDQVASTDVNKIFNTPT